MVKTRVIDTPVKEKKIVIPAKYQTVTTKVQKTQPYLRWQPILCETNTTTNIISKLQRILKDKKYYTGKISGKYDSKTRSAVRAYQKANNLSQGALTLKTLQSLGL